jgi:uncharacterized membrane protein
MTSLAYFKNLRLIAACALVVVALAAAGCGSKQVSVTGSNGQTTTQSVKNIHFANTKFVLHAGLAFGAFHRYIYKPLRHGTTHRVAALGKAALAAAFIVHELRIAREDALSSNQLRPLLGKLDTLEGRITGLIPGLKNGSISAGSVSGAADALNSVGSQSGGLGANIKDITHAL